MKWIVVNPSWVDQAQDLIVAFPVIGFAIVVVLAAAFASWAR